MVKYRGHSILKQYVKGKPIQWGFKMWCRCDSKSGYLFEFDLYTGKKCGVEYGLGKGVVIQLTEKLMKMGCEIYVDNFFNSPLLQKVLLEREVFCAGTVRPNRKHLPKSAVPADKAMARGEVAAFQAGSIQFVKWMDNKPVHMLSNFLSAFPLTQVTWRKKGSKDKLQVKCPAMVKQYNEHMGGVDIMDQKKWPISSIIARATNITCDWFMT